MMEYTLVEFKPGSREESLPDFDPAFPHRITRSAFREGPSAPWHWHRAVELFYVESGTLEILTPAGAHIFPAGSGGMVNANVLHMSRGHTPREENCHILHLFSPELISGSQGSRMEQKYVLPLTTAQQIELIPLEPGSPRQLRILERLRRSFELEKEEPGYELRIRAELSEIWLDLLELVKPMLAPGERDPEEPALVKQMMAFIHAHYGEKLTVKAIAEAACVSERTCFHLFRKILRTTPGDYLNSYRLRTACALLAQTEEPVSRISEECGMNNSYFSQMFREATGFTPLEYRRFYHRQQSGMTAGHMTEKKNSE